MTKITFLAASLILTLFISSRGLTQEIEVDDKAVGRLADVLSARKLDDAGIQTRGRGDIFTKYVTSVPLVISADATGSSAVLRTNLPESTTLVVTNNHVVDSPFANNKGQRFVLLVFYDSQLASEPFDHERVRSCMRTQAASGWCRTFQQAVRPALVIGTDPSHDLALMLVRNAPKEAVEIPTGQIEAVKPGDDVVVLGHPFDLLWSLTTGVVSAVRQQFPIGQPPNNGRATVIQTQTPVNPGNSGGPMMTPEGRLVGVVFAQRMGQVISAPAQGPGGPFRQDVGIPAPGINFAIGVNEVQSLLAEFDKRVRK
jgi:S1-C subfamily serine protease